MAGRISYYGGIVKDGLVLDLDAAKIDSYPKTGTSWKDISGNGNNGTLINGPVFNSENNGGIVFDGINEYVSCGNILNYTTGNFSFSYWVYINSLTTNSVGQGPVVLYKGGYQINGYYDQIQQTTGIVSFITNTNPVISTATAAGTIVAGNTYNITYTRNGTSIRIYVNGVDLTNTAGVHTTIPSSTANFTIASYQAGFICSNIRVYSFLNYNRALSAAEVLQNYNATKSRYI